MQGAQFSQNILVSTPKWLTFTPSIQAHIDGLTLKHREMHGCVVSTVATDALVLKHQAISILSTY